MEVCKLLLAAGAAHSARDSAGDTPLQRAARSAHVKVCKLLRERAALLERRREEEKYRWEVECITDPDGACTDNNEAWTGRHGSACATNTLLAAETVLRSAVKRPTSLAPDSHPRPLEIDTDLDELVCDWASQLANRDRLPGHVFPLDVRPPKGSRCFGR